MKTKQFLNNIAELENIYYNPKNYEKRNSYEKHLRNPIGTFDELNQSERNIKNIFSFLGEIKKIEEYPDLKTPDFGIINKDILIEVKSINLVEEGGTFNWKTEKGWIEKINLTINDALQKFNSFKMSLNNNQNRILAIEIESIYYLLGNGKRLWKKDFIEKTIFLNNNIEGLLISHSPFYGNEENRKPILFIKSADFYNLLIQLNPNDKINICLMK